VVSFACYQLYISTSAACDGCTAARTKFDIVQDGADRNYGKRKSVADFRGDIITGSDLLTYFQSGRSDDVALLAVFVDNEGDACAAVRIILDGLYCGGVFVLVAEEVDDAVHAFVPAADVADGLFALIVASAARTVRSEQ